MAAWQVEFYMVPRRAFANSGALSAATLSETKWWANHNLPSDYQRRLAAIAPAASSATADLQTWGTADSNRVDVWSDNGRVSTLMTRVDVRRLDSKFGAALLQFVRGVDALLVRSDGLVVEPTIAAYAAALRNSAAWKFASDPASHIARYSEDDDDNE
jgi:hypothetical protein